MLGKSISKNSLMLGAFAVFTAGVLAVTFSATKDKIAVEERKAAQKALLQIVPADRHNNDMLADIWTLDADGAAALGLQSESHINLAKQGDNIIAVIIPSTAPDGYSGDIKMIIGINTKDNSIAGVRVLTHKETPGLGDKIDLNKDDWILSFNKKSLSNPSEDKWKVKKDGGEFDQFTGATITPRAVVKRVKETLEYFIENKDKILSNAVIASGE